MMPTLHLLETRQLLAGQFTGADSDGTRVSVTLEGRGTLFAQLVEDKLFVSTKRTNGRSMLTVAGKGGDGHINLSDVTIAGSLGVLSAPSAILSRSLSVDHTLGSLALHSVTQARIEGQIFGRVAITQDMIQGRIVALPVGDAMAIGHLSVGRRMQHSVVTTLGDIGRVDVGSMERSAVTAGVAIRSSAEYEYLYLPEGPVGDPLREFVGRYGIGEVNVAGYKRVGFADSFIAAADLGDVYIATAHNARRFSTFGIASQTSNSIEIKYGETARGLVVRDLDAPATSGTGAGSITANVTSGTLALPTRVPANGLRVAWSLAIPHAPPDSQDVVLLMPDGTYTMRSHEGKILHRSRDLPGILTAFFKTAGQVVAVVRTEGEVTFLGNRSTEPSITSTPEDPFFFGQTVVVNTKDGKVTLDDDYDASSPITIPTVRQILRKLSGRGVPNLLLNQYPTFFSGAVTIGSFTDPTGWSTLGIAEDGSYRRGRDGTVITDLRSFLLGTGERRGGTRRLPPRIIQDSLGRIIIRGDNLGGDAIISTSSRDPFVTPDLSVLYAPSVEQLRKLFP